MIRFLMIGIPLLIAVTAIGFPFCEAIMHGLNTDACADRPFLVWTVDRKVLIEQVRRNRKGMEAVGGAFEPPLLPRFQRVLAHQTGNASAPDRKAAVAQLVHHAWAAIGLVRNGKARPDVGQHHRGHAGSHTTQQSVGARMKAEPPRQPFRGLAAESEPEMTLHIAQPLGSAGKRPCDDIDGFAERPPIAG